MTARRPSFRSSTTSASTRRAATKLVQLASKYPCDVQLSHQGQSANAKSVMGVLLLVRLEGNGRRGDGDGRAGGGVREGDRRAHRIAVRGAELMAERRSTPPKGTRKSERPSGPGVGDADAHVASDVPSSGSRYRRRRRRSRRACSISITRTPSRSRASPARRASRSAPRSCSATCARRSSAGTCILHRFRRSSSASSRASRSPRARCGRSTRACRRRCARRRRSSRRTR